MSVEGVNATALRSLRCDSALMSALQRLSERGSIRGCGATWGANRT